RPVARSKSLEVASEPLVKRKHAPDGLSGAAPGTISSADALGKAHTAPTRGSECVTRVQIGDLLRISGTIEVRRAASSSWFFIECGGELPAARETSRHIHIQNMTGARSSPAHGARQRSQGSVSGFSGPADLNHSPNLRKIPKLA